MNKTLKLASDSFDETDLSGLHLDKETVQLAYELASEIELHPETAGRKPESVAATCLYVAAERCDQSRSMPAIAECFGVTDTAIHRNREWVSKQADWPKVRPMSDGNLTISYLGRGGLLPVLMGNAAVIGALLWTQGATVAHTLSGIFAAGFGGLIGLVAVDHYVDGEIDG